MQDIKMDYHINVQKIFIPKGQRVIITSDIHGNLMYLKGLLHKVAFSKEDILIIAGDIVEKGNKSLATLRYLIELQKTHQVYLVYGNVDARVIEHLVTPEIFYNRYCSRMQFWGHCIYKEMLMEQGMILPEKGKRSIHAVKIEETGTYKEVSIEEAWHCIREVYKKELQFIQNLPVILDAGDFLVTHAGLPSEAYQGLSPKEVEQMVGWRNFQDEGLYFSKYVFVGHWPVTIYKREHMDSSPIINREKKIISLDGGCVVKRDGQLNAVIFSDIASEKFEIVSYDDFPTARVLENSVGSKESFYIRWQDRHVEWIKDVDEGSIVRVLNTKEEHWIPKQYLWEEEDGLSCSDYTDYVLPLKAGEEVSVLGEYKKGYLVRKNGVLGWYFGLLEYLLF